MRKAPVLVFVFLCACLSGCNNSVTDFVKTAKPNNFDPPSMAPPATITYDGTMALKVSPGRMSASDTNGAVIGYVTPTKKSFSAGSDMAVSLTMSGSRASPQ